MNALQTAKLAHTRSIRSNVVAVIIGSLGCVRPEAVPHGGQLRSAIVKFVAYLLDFK